MEDFYRIKKEIAETLKRKLENNSFNVRGYELKIRNVNSIEIDIKESNIQWPDLYQGQDIDIEIRGTAFINEKQSNGFRVNSISFFAEHCILRYNQKSKEFSISNISEIIIIEKLH